MGQEDPGTLGRLDVLPANGFHARLVLAGGSALLAASAMGLQSTGRALPDLGFAVALALGGVGGGFVADRAGRRPVVLGGSLVVLGCALLVLAGAWSGLAVAGAAAGILGAAACGALLAAGLTLVAESAPVSARVVLVLGLIPFIAAGPLLPPAAAAVPAILALALRRWLSESPRWLLARGRAVEADAVVRRAERAAGAPAITLARVAPAVPTPARVRDVARSGAVGLVLAVLLAHAAGAGAALHLVLAVALGPAALLVWLEGSATPVRAFAVGLGVVVFSSGVIDSNAVGATAAGLLSLIAFALALMLRPARGRGLEKVGAARRPST